MKLHVNVLGSASFGNCTVIWDNENSIMVDCGFSQRYTLDNLEKLNLKISELNGVLITHTHTDHVKTAMLNRLTRDKVPIFCHHNIGNELTAKFEAMRKAKAINLLQTFDGEKISIGQFKIQNFKVPHDSAGGCYGFNIFKESNNNIKKISIATDVGYHDENIVKYFTDSDIIIIESNHDLDMLENSNRPYSLKQRIKNIGHLSNNQCAELLVDVLNRSKKMPEAIVLAHISQDCNTNDIAKTHIKDALKKDGFGMIPVYLTHKSAPNEILSIE